MKNILFLLMWGISFSPVFAQQLITCNLDEKITATTSASVKLPKELTNPDYHNAVIAIKGLSAGLKYQATLSYEAGSGIYFSLGWLDGSPFQTDYRRLGGLSSETGRGTRLAGYEIYQLFLVDPKSSSDTIYLIINTDKIWTFNLTVAKANPSITKDTKNSYGYYAATDWTEGGKIAFLLKAQSSSPPKPNSNALIEIKPGDKISLTTASGIKLPSSFGSLDKCYTVVRLKNLQKGLKYQLTLTYEGGTDICYNLSWVDGLPTEKVWRVLGSLGSATGKGPLMPGYETYHLFALSAQSQKSELYLVISSDKPWKISLGLSQAKSGIDELTKNSYGFFATQDWTRRGKAFFELN